MSISLSRVWQRRKESQRATRTGSDHTVTERRVDVAGWIEDVRSGEIAEVFACGTAAGISPIGVLKGADFSVGDAEAPPGEVTMAIRKDLLDIQYGRAPDRHGWLTRLV